jgi:hypothetical protein
MTERNNEDIEIRAACRIEECELCDDDVTVDGRYNAEGEFEAFNPEDLSCDAGGGLLVLDQTGGPND